MRQDEYAAPNDSEPALLEHSEALGGNHAKIPAMLPQHPKEMGQNMAPTISKKQKRILDQENAEQLRALKKEIAKTQVISALLGNEKRGEHDGVSADQIVKGIRKRIADFPKMVLRGRGVGSTRIDYSPNVKDVTGITARIQQAQAAEFTDEQIDEMLRPLVAWNRSAFQDIPKDALDRYSKKCTVADPKRHLPQWTLHQKSIAGLSPITWSKRSKVVEAVFNSVRQRCISMSPGNSLLRKPDNAVPDKKVLEWSLLDKTAGFGAKLMECFDEPGKAPEVYADQIETCLYKFRMKNKEAVYGPA